MMRVAVCLLFALAPSLSHGQLSEPVRIVDEDLPYAAPTMGDINGDGLSDLIVGVYRTNSYVPARVRGFINVGSAQSPKFEDGKWIQADGEDVHIDEVCHTGAGPTLVDINGDSKLDLVSGQRNCQLYVSAGRGNGEFSSPMTIDYASDPSKSQLKYNSRVLTFDWDGDGDLDLLATVRKAIWIVVNNGNPKTPTFASPRVLIETAREQHYFSSCDVSDWDNDGDSDLIVAMWDGSVDWYRNDSDQTNGNLFDAERLSDPIQLIPPAGSRTVSMEASRKYVRPDKPSGHARISVVDFDNDGMKDILLGDAWVTSIAYKDRLPETDLQLATRRSAMSKESGLRREFQQLARPAAKETADKKRIRIQALNRIRAECSLAWNAAHANQSHVRHGQVWLYRRTGL